MSLWEVSFSYCCVGRFAGRQSIGDLRADIIAAPVSSGPARYLGGIALTGTPHTPSSHAGLSSVPVPSSSPLRSRRRSGGPSGPPQPAQIIDNPFWARNPASPEESDFQPDSATPSPKGATQSPGSEHPASEHCLTGTPPRRSFPFLREQLRTSLLPVKRSWVLSSNLAVLGVLSVVMCVVVGLRQTAVCALISRSSAPSILPLRLVRFPLMLLLAERPRSAVVDFVARLFLATSVSPKMSWTHHRSLRLKILWFLAPVVRPVRDVLCAG